MKIEGLHKTRTAASKKRTSISGALRIAKNADHTEFWQKIKAHIAKDSVTVPWLLEHAGDLAFKREVVGEDAQGKRIFAVSAEKREKWNAWTVQQIIVNYLATL